ncbi:MAG TPA: prepilin-type N-terminal cleavage/methylation domain-containing protein [Candidatus Saccharimonadales bacterium]|nr:prepilin-type N-terminal cleavage/methylation domain-containing protein [Candidatus Saccharimonadales bacterium]
MLQKLQKRKESGFTIIEVLIVLAIAGLIMLVVFLAVPALQRNSRNTTYRNEASRLLDAYAEISANKGGSVLGGTTEAADVTAVMGAANTKSITSLGIKAGNTGTLPANTDTALIRTGVKCNTSLDDTTSGSTRQVVVLFRVETSGGTQLQCVEG